MEDIVIKEGAITALHTPVSNPYTLANQIRPPSLQVILLERTQNKCRI